MFIEDPKEFLNRFSPRFGDEMTTHALCSFDRLSKILAVFPGNFPLIEAMLALVFQQEKLNLNDVNTCVAAFSPSTFPESIPKEVYEELQIIHINYHQFSHVFPYFSKLHDLGESQRLAIKQAAVKIFAITLTDSIIPYLEISLDDFSKAFDACANALPEVRMGLIGKFSSQLSSKELYCQNIEDALLRQANGLTDELDLKSFLRILTKASVEILAKRRLNQGQFSPPPSTLFADHQLPRIRHLAAKENSKKIVREIPEDEVMATRYIQRWWRRWMLSPRTVKVNSLSGNHSDEAHHVVALDPNVRKSVNPKSIAHFVEVMKTEKWAENKIFQEDHYQYYAISAYLSGKISRWQLTTVLKYRSAKQDLGEMQVFPILVGEYHETTFEAMSHFVTRYSALKPIIEGIPFEEMSKREDRTISLTREQGEALSEYREVCSKMKTPSSSLPFTQEALRYLLPNMMLDPKNKLFESHFRKPLTQEQFNDFSLRVGKLPPSERIFYKPLHMTEEKAAQNILFKKDYPPVYLSESAYHAYKETVYAEKNSLLDSRFGQFSKEDIEAGERENVRPGALASGKSFQTMKVHGVKVTQHAAENHDAYHAEVFSNISPYFKPMIFAILDCLRVATDHQWSTELWQIVDALYVSALSATDVNNSVFCISEKPTFWETNRFFSHLLNTDFSPLLRTFASGPLALVLALDLVTHPVKWKNLNVLEKNLTGDIKKTLDYVHQYYRATIGIPVGLAILKLQIFYHRNMEKNLQLNEKIETLFKQKKLSDFGFRKGKEKAGTLMIHRLSFYYGDLILDEKEAVKKVVDLIERQYVALAFKSAEKTEKILKVYASISIDPKKNLGKQIEQRLEGQLFLYADPSLMLDTLESQSSIMELRVSESMILAKSIFPLAREFLFWGKLTRKENFVALYDIDYFKNPDRKEPNQYQFFIGKMHKNEKASSENFAGMRKGFLG